MNFIRVASACPVVNVGDIKFNIENIKKCINLSIKENSKLIVLPELSITGYTCADLFLNQTLIEESIEGIKDICNFSLNKDILISVGAPLLYNYCLYNCAYIIYNGKILGIVPKSYLPNYSEFYEKRWFTEGYNLIDKKVDLSFQKNIPFGINLIFSSGTFKFGFEICEDLWTVIPPSSYLALMGANIIGNLSASNELVSKADYRTSIVSSQSARCMCSYVYASSGVFESTTDVVFSGHLIISENGRILRENDRFQRENQIITSIIDVDKLNNMRIKNLSFRDSKRTCPFAPFEIVFEFNNTNIDVFDRPIHKHPFVPANEHEREIRSKEIFNIQSSGLAKRLNHTRLEKVIVGISGGLDSTLALLVAVNTFDLLKIPRKNIITITMPGFGTTDRTYNNAVDLCKKLGTDFREINIVNSCLQHFKDIGHPAEIHDITYENVQARERTQILMDLANKEGALLIGTGDLSEIALGWATYNGDHMSMYSVNCSIPKTLVRYLVQFAAEHESEDNISEILIDILNTPVSPELLPKDKDGKIAQKTEDIVGPYELHDFFLYYFIRQNATPEKILLLAKKAFKNDYDEDTIKKWLDKFIRRFFTQQFKRSAIPDGPKVGTISLSPRGDLKMPSDASYNLWIENLK
ncbi:NAD(+) synthase [Clostridium botulinum]|uniref:Glutamine-dependent NAD(+) synthetase n=1 Tax=Clostridium botulinum TaxID=1491 RepID=A0A9Q1UXN6_CLOBO|nr:NAD(+) synthase [Clostridium botulinum]AEB76552.1 NAD+ synthetase [Clostridium botulinum BKT015925]KEH97423.1 NAD synthetase [Clostridium botulinum D str. 16868]KEI04059.1 NAD synthetase [Clostridium botulinum C/D str. Sp77]KLU76067.1 NAD synthetase [Clostridium botulinum V891]KOA74241.1 NAD synthetase [Clostridium botulinum]